tara:strand:- start:1031 stop:1222 length:192 start_codon:yes stop_codon:yes gene_type:complete
MIKVLHEFQHENRKAQVNIEDGLFYVYCYENEEFVKTINLVGYNEQYAEDTAENWVMRVGAFK